MVIGREDHKGLDKSGQGLRWAAFLCIAGLILFSGCSVRRMAVNEVADAMASAGGSVQSDDDPELIRDAAPFQLKLLEGMLAESPDHEGLLLAAASGFTQYAYAFVQQDADRAEDEDLARARALRDRARRLYRRAQGYGMRGLEVRHPGFGDALSRDPHAAVAGTGTEDVPLLYWTSAAWASAIALSKNDPEALADLPLPVALAERALLLDEGFDGGALHVFFLVYEAGRPGGGPEATEKARAHFERAVALSGGGMASPYVALAESIAVRNQDKAAFEELLQKALAIDPDAEPSARLQNMILQKRARWLLEQTNELFAE
jgi:predicted anti-sigma-YlaC factor YlaD